MRDSATPPSPKETAAQLREAQRIAGIGSWEWRVGGDEITWSEGLHLIVGRDLELGPPTFATLSSCYTPESWARLGVAIAAAIEHGTPYELDLTMLRGDGQPCPTTTRCEAVCGPDGRVERLRGIVHDITERTRAEKAYREREAQLREAQRIAGIGSWEWSPSTDVITWSEGLYLILGRDVVLGPPSFATLSQHYTPESWARLREAVGSALERGVPYELDLEMVCDDGTTRWTTTRGEAVHGPDGTVASLRGTVHDITERKRLQAITNQADRLSSMGLLAAGVAHEINNPLTYVLYNVESLAAELPRILGAAERCAAALRSRVGPASFATLVGEGSELLQPAVLHDAIDRAREAVEGSQRINVLIRCLGTFSRVEKVEETDIDPSLAIESAINMAQNEMKFRARLVKDLGTVPTVWASLGKLSQVFLNLLINAAHAIDEGHVEDNFIRIRTWCEGNAVFAEVADTGRGIHADDLERIFEPFFSTKQVGKGSGLGLAICRNLVASFGGEITVASELGIGTCFTIRLPTKAAVPATAPVSDDVKATRTVRGRILVIDDEPAIRKTLQRLLGDSHEVVIADSGVEGRQILESDHRFDAILCDLMMPEMTGMQLHEWIAANHPALSRRVVFITGGIFTPRAAQYLASVDNLRVHKPFVIEELETLVDGLIESTTASP